MRVITGIARGRRLRTLDGDDIVRPTAEKVKEAVFSIIQFDIEGRNVLDLFAGSGQMGIEALSRGARRCTFVDASRQSIEVVRQNVRACGFEDSSSIVLSDSLGYLSRCRERFDIAFLDPPYASGLIPRALEPLSSIMNKGGVILCETAKDTELPDIAGCFTKRRIYSYGSTQITLYRHEEVES